MTRATDLGYKAIINHKTIGLIYLDEVFQPIQMGQKLKGYIKAIREDQKIDLCLQLPGQDARDELCDRILQHLKANDGQSTLTDKSPPDAIYKAFGVSKGAYKRAIGALYKQRLISTDPQAIKLIEP